MFVDPAGRTAYYWMALVTAAVAYNWFVILLRVAFEDMRCSDVHMAFRALDIISDVIYLMDVAIQSRTAYLEDGCLVTTLPETVREYRNQPRFVLDVLSVVPLASLTSYLSKICPLLPFQSGSTEITTPGLRILRLLKYPSMNRFFEKTDSRTNNPNLLRAFKLWLHLWLVIHWIGCFYYLLSQYEGLGSNDWVYPNATEYSAFSRKYIYCMYWSTMTLTTIGERPWPVTDVEYIFTGLTFLIGVFVFAAVVGNVGDVISNMNAARHDFQARMDQIKFYLNHRHVPEHLQDQIKRWAEYTWARTKAINEHSMLQLLPNRLRTEVAIHVHLQTLKKVRIFEQCEEGLLRELVLKLRPSIYSPGEYICRIGEIGREMYIIDHGKVEILFPEQHSGQTKQVAVMMPGNYFGEISLLKLDEGQNKRTADVRSIGFSELLCLSRRDLMAALMEYPEAKKILETQARQRMQQTKWTSGQGVGSGNCPDSPQSSQPPGSWPRPGTVRRSARSIFAEVMKQEGFSKLLSCKANQELTEMRQILKELKEIKSHLSETTVKQLAQHCQTLEQQLLQKEQELQQTRSQLLLHRQGLSIPLSITPNDMSPPIPNTRTPSALSFMSPVGSPCLVQRVPSPGARSVQSSLAGPTEATGGVGGVSPPRVPGTATAHKRRRLSPTSRAQQSAEEDRLLYDTFNRATGELVQDVDGVFGVAQGGGGDELAVKAVPKDLALAANEEEEEEERHEGPLQTWNGGSDSGSCATDRSPVQSSADACASVDSAVGRPAIRETSPPDPQQMQRHLKPAAVCAELQQSCVSVLSDSFKSLASESTTSSQYTTYTDSCSTTSSSGSRGPGPKPAKPRPRYKEEETSESDTQAGGGGADGKAAQEKGALCEQRARSTLPTTTTGDVVLSSEGFSALSNISSSWGTDSVVSSCPTERSDSFTANAAMQQREFADQSTNSQSLQQAPEAPAEAENTLAVCRSAAAPEQKMSELEKDDLSPMPTFPALGSSPEEQQYANDSTMVEAVAMCREFFPNAEEDDDSQGRDVDDADDSSDVDGEHFIPATRVKGALDNRVSKEEQVDVPKPVTCRKIDDNQLSILLAKRREVNDCADYTVESPPKATVPEGSPSAEKAPRADHGHSINTVMESPDRTKELNKLEPNDLGSENENHASNRVDSTPVVCEGPAPARLEHSILAFGRKARYSKVEFAFSPPASANADSQENDSTSICPADTEPTRAEEQDGVKSVCSSERVLQSDTDGNVDSQNSQQLTQVEGMEKSWDGMGSGERVSSGPQVGREKEKSSPVSILKKPTFELELGKQDLNREAERQKSSTIEETILPAKIPTAVFDENVPPSDGIGVCSNKPKSPPVTCVSLAKDAQNCKSGYAWKDCDSDFSPVECDSSNWAAETKTPETKKTKRRRRGDLNAAVQMGLFPLKRKNHVDRSTSDSAEMASTESASLANPSGVPFCEENPVHPNTSSETAQKAPQDENADENLTRLRRRYSASRYRRRSLDQTRESTDTSSDSQCTLLSKPPTKKDVSFSSAGRSSPSANGSESPSAGKHSEKFDTLIATFESPKKKSLREDSVGDVKIATSKDSAEKSKTSDSTGDKKGPAPAAHSKSPTAEKKVDPKESRKDSSSSKASTPSSSPTQKRKTLRRRSLTKRLSNPYGKKEGVSSDKSKTSPAKEGNEMATATQKDTGAAGQQPPEENTKRSISLTQTPAWEKDTSKKSASADPEGETKHNAPGDETSDKVSLEVGDAMISTESNSTLIGDSELQLCSSLCLWSTSLESSVDGSRSLTLPDTQSAKSTKDECKEGCRTKLPDPLRPKEDTTPREHHLSVSSSDGQATALREKSTSTGRQLSFRDKIQQAAKRFRSGETLDRANNSIASPLRNFTESSSPSPPPNYNITQSERSSYKPGKPMLPPTSMSGDMMSHCADRTKFLAPKLGRQNGPPPVSVSLSDAVAKSGTKMTHSDSTAGRLGAGPEDLTSFGNRRLPSNGQQGGDNAHDLSPPTAKTMQDLLQLENAQSQFRAENTYEPSQPVVENAPYPLYTENTQQHLRMEEGKTHEHSQAGTENELPHVGRENPHEHLSAEKGGPDSAQSCTDTECSQDETLLERMVGITMVETLRLHPSLLQSAEASFEDDSAGEGEGEGAGSLILLADFGVEDNDDEAALTDMSGCGEHSDINSDLDEI